MKAFLFEINHKNKFILRLTRKNPDIVNTYTTDSQVMYVLTHYSIQYGVCYYIVGRKVKTAF